NTPLSEVCSAIMDTSDRRQEGNTGGGCGRRITCKQSRTTANHTWPVGSSRQGRIQIASAERRLLAGDPFLLRRAAAGGHAGVWPQGLQITADRRCSKPRRSGLRRARYRRRSRQSAAAEPAQTPSEILCLSALGGELWSARRHMSPTKRRRPALQAMRLTGGHASRAAWQLRRYAIQTSICLPQLKS